MDSELITFAIASVVRDFHLDSREVNEFLIGFICGIQLDKKLFLKCKDFIQFCLVKTMSNHDKIIYEMSEGLINLDSIPTGYIVLSTCDPSSQLGEGWLFGDISDYYADMKLDWWKKRKRRHQHSMINGPPGWEMTSHIYVDDEQIEKFRRKIEKYGDAFDPTPDMVDNLRFDATLFFLDEIPEGFPLVPFMAPCILHRIDNMQG